jgi:hypothetical protein
VTAVGAIPPNTTLCGAPIRAHAEHRNYDLRDHRQIDPDHVALPHSEILQGIREQLHVTVQVSVGDHPLLAFLTGPMKRHTTPATSVDMAVQTVIENVQLAVRKPLVKRRVRVVENSRERLVPMQLSGLLSPERVGIAVRPRLQVNCVDSLGAAEVRRGGNRS